jgi:hypothetical protein
MNKKKFQKYASIAEIVSAVAIVVSLLYVGYEIRRTEVLSSRDIDELLFERNLEANRVLIENADIARIIVKAQDNPDELTPADRIRYLAFEHNFYDSWEIAFYAHTDGVLIDANWNEWNEFYMQEARRRPKFAWTENRHNFVGAFADYVDGLLLE